MFQTKHTHTAKITGFVERILTVLLSARYLFIYSRPRLIAELVLCLPLNSNRGLKTGTESEEFSLSIFDIASAH